MGIGDFINKLTSKEVTEDAVPDSLDKETTEQGVAQWVKSKVEEARQAPSRTAHESVWMQNCAYTLGFTGLYFNPYLRNFVPVTPSGKTAAKNRLQVNKILPNLQNRLARILKSPPRFDVRPSNATQDARDQARFKLDVLTYLWDQLKINNMRIECHMWASQCGHAYYMVNWDDTLGKLMPIVDPITGEERQEFEGDIRVDVCSGFEVFPDPYARSMREARYFIRAKVRPLEYFRDHYGEKGMQVKEEGVWLLSAQFENRINTMSVRGGSGQPSAAIKNAAIELTYMERPSRRHPEGRMVIVASGVTLVDKALPVGKMPLVRIDDIPVGGKFYPEAVVTHVRPIQDQFNSVVRRRADWTNKMLAGKYSAPRGANLAREALNDSSGEVVYYDPMPQAAGGGEPKPMQIPTIPQYAYNEEDRLDAQFAEIMGISEVSKGSLPSASIPALGMQILVEQDDTRIGIMTMQHEQAYAELGALILDYAHMGYQTPRMMKFAGKNQYTIKELTGDAIGPDNDVVVVPGSTQPGSKVLKRQEIINAYQMGLLGDPSDPRVREKLTEMLEYGDISEMFIDQALDEQAAKREKEAIKAGQPYIVHETDNHPYIMVELVRFRKSDEFIELKAVNPMIESLWDQVFNQHIQMLALASGQPLPGSDEANALNPPPPPPEETAPLVPEGNRVVDIPGEGPLPNQ